MPNLKKKATGLFYALILIIVCATFFISPKFSKAQDGVQVWGEGDIAKTAIEEQTGMRAQDPRITIVNIIRIGLGFLGIIAVIIIIYAGYLWMMAGGNAEQIEKAKMLMRNAAIGLAIILSAFAIVSFILSKLIAATGGAGGLEGQLCKEGDASRICGCGGLMSCQQFDGTWRWSGCVGSDCGGGDSFIISSTSPKNEAVNVIRNAKIRLYFNKTIDAGTVAADTFTVKSGDADIAGAVAVNGRVIEFTPSSPCPTVSCAGAEAKCFSENMNVAVVAVSPNSLTNTPGIKSADGKNLECANDMCSFSFDTGSVIDCESPEVELISPGQICASTVNRFGVNSSDVSSQVEKIDFYVNGEISGDGAVNSSGAKPFNIAPDISTPFVWDSTGYDKNNVSFKATAYDQDDHSASDSNAMVIRPTHCCNTVKDEDEESIDCGGTDCAACKGAACGVNMNLACGDNNCDDNNCASGFCNCGPHADGTAADDSCQEKGYSASVANQCCVCEEKPEIYWIKEPNGAPGNLVTIGGRNFGAAQGNGKVEFIGEVKELSGAEYEYTFENDLGEWELQGGMELVDEKIQLNLNHNLATAVLAKEDADFYGIWELDVIHGDNLELIQFSFKDNKMYRIKIQSDKIILSNESEEEIASADVTYDDNDTIKMKIEHNKDGGFIISADDIDIISANSDRAKFNKLELIAFETNISGGFDNIKFTPVEIVKKGAAEALLAGAVNEACAYNDWSDTRIVVQVPLNTFEGEYAVRVTANTGFSDSEKFTVNTTERPGLCLAYKEINGEKKSEGKFEEKTNLAGINLNDIDKREEIFFGSANADISSNIGAAATLIQGAAVPNLTGGGLTVFVKDAAGEKSNPVDFTILETSKTPRIYGFEPKAGHSGDYVRIWGQGFGAAQGGSNVYFIDSSDTETAASYSFPDECLASYWSDNQIIVKVPGGLAFGDYAIKAEIALDGDGFVNLTHKDEFYVGDYCSGDYAACSDTVNCSSCVSKADTNKEICIDEAVVQRDAAITECARDTSCESNAETAYDDAVGVCEDDAASYAASCNIEKCVKSVCPGLCKISPIMGPAKMPVDFYGENFGVAIGKAEFNGEKEIEDPNDSSKTIKRVEKIQVTPSNWTKGTGGGADIAKANVPIKDPAGNMPITPITGQIKIISASSMESYGLRFEVGSCEADAQCNISGGGTSFVCCGDNTEYKGACMENQNDCGFVLHPPTDYIWSFSTEAPTVSALCSKLKDETSCVSASDSINCCWEDFDNATICRAEGTCYKEIPRVVEHCGYNQSDLACKDNIGGPSPSPWAGDPRYDTIVGHPGGNQACIDSKIRAEFNVAMQISTFDNSTVEITRCNTCPAGENDCLFENQCAGNITESVINGDNKNFEFKYDGILSANSWYKVKLASGGIKSQAGIMLDGNRDGVEGGDYEWIFKTRAADNKCEPGCPTVAPDKFTAIDQTAKKYSGEVTAEDNRCVLLDRELQWNWNLSESGQNTYKARFCDNNTCACCDPNNEDCAGSDWKCVEPLKETLENTPVKVKGEVSVNGQKKSDYGELYIDFTNFSVESFWPNCNDSCLNAAVGARFSGEINNTNSAGKVGLYECSELDDSKRCSAYAPQSLAETAAGQAQLVSESILNVGNPLKGKIDLPLLNGKNFEPDKWYRVVIKGGADGVRSGAGGGLDGLNYDSSNDSKDVNDAFSWEFKTGAKSCEVDTVSVEPAYGVVGQIGDGLMYNAEPKTVPDICNGQKLDAYSYDWRWATSTPANSPQDVIYTDVSDYPECGNGIVEIGEDCDEGEWRIEGREGIEGIEGNVDDGIGCSSICTNEGSTVLCGASAVGCCGNGDPNDPRGAAEAGEECDDGGNVSGDGCSAECLWEGSGIYDNNDFEKNSICGDGEIGYGEECELGMQGCSSICLWMGTATACSEDITENCCGNGQIDEGGWEECDEGANGNKDDGVGCSSKCLREGVGACSGECCGNGKIDAGEGCDLGDKNGEAGGLCDDICLHTGNSSTCGNGIIEAGEDCDEKYGCDATSCLHTGTVTGTVGTSTPYQFVKAIDGPAAGQTAATTDITATEAASLKFGTGKFTIQCGYQNDSQCPAGRGVGNNGCCYQRPIVVSPLENLENICPNGVINVVFDQIMDKDGLEKAAILEKRSDGVCPAVQGVSSIKYQVLSGENEIRNWKLEIKKLFYKLFNIFIGNGLISLDNLKTTPQGMALNTSSAIADLSAAIHDNNISYNNNLSKSKTADEAVLDRGGEQGSRTLSLKGINQVSVGDASTGAILSTRRHSFNYSIGNKNFQNKNIFIAEDVVDSLRNWVPPTDITYNSISGNFVNTIYPESIFYLLKFAERALVQSFTDVKTHLAGLVNFAKADGENWCKVGQKIISRTNTAEIEAVLSGEAFEYTFEDELGNEWELHNAAIQQNASNSNKVIDITKAGNAILNKEGRFYGTWEMDIKHGNNFEKIFFERGSEYLVAKLEIYSNENSILENDNNIRWFFSNDGKNDENTSIVLAKATLQDGINHIKINSDAHGIMKLHINNTIIDIDSYDYDFTNIKFAAGNDPTKNDRSSQFDNIKFTPMVLSEAVQAGTGTIATIMPTALLESGAEYRLSFDGLKGISGVAVADTAYANKIKVSARSEICLVDRVDVLIDYTFSNATTTNDIFICAGRDDCGAKTETTLDDDADTAVAGNQHLYRANALDKDENELTADFTWLEHDSYSNQGAIRIEDGGLSQKYITAFPLEEAKASVEIGAYDGYGYDSAATSTVDIQLYMCENPWPPISEFPYEDSEYNFSTYVCLDAGAENDAADNFTGFGKTCAAGDDRGKHCEDSDGCGGEECKINPIGSYSVCHAATEDRGTRCSLDNECGDWNTGCKFICDGGDNDGEICNSNSDCSSGSCSGDKCYDWTNQASTDCDSHGACWQGTDKCETKIMREYLWVEE